MPSGPTVAPEWTVVPVLVGGPQAVADAIERRVDEGGVDGFNLAYAVTPASTTDFIDFVVPELRKRGRAQSSAATGRGVRGAHSRWRRAVAMMLFVRGARSLAASRFTCQ
ncbi:hypothetical protein [Paenirhodobacter populi]|uniref:hypothetical protein n=1 Tax=Paenirhodobacter populi TaxID=2306993 RepID=UPI0019D44BBD|nr:hypothetical protein [Sinirhodobacter populi]